MCVRESERETIAFRSITATTNRRPSYIPYKHEQNTYLALVPLRMQAGAGGLDDRERPVAVQGPAAGGVEWQGFDVGVKGLILLFCVGV